MTLLQLLLLLIVLHINMQKIKEFHNERFLFKPLICVRGRLIEALMVCEGAVDVSAEVRWY